jgi:GntR family transcriptional regulator
VETLAASKIQSRRDDGSERRDELSRAPGKLYQSVGETLKQEIASGRFADALVLPGERELAESHGVSRATLRRAIDALVGEGLLFHRQGAGTFIRRATPRVDQMASRLTGFTEVMRMRGFVASSRKLEAGVFLPTPDEAMMLGVNPADHVVRLSRLRLADDVPMAIEHSVIPQHFLPDPEAIGHSLYDALEARELRPMRGLQRLRAMTLGDADAQLLGVPANSPTLYIQRIAYLADGRCVEFTRSYYRADRYDFVSEITVSSSTRRSRP